MFDSLRRIVPQYVRRSYALKFAISLLVLGLVVMGIGIVATEAVRGGVEENTLTQHEAAAQAEADAFENIHRKNKEYVNMAIETKLIREYEAGDEQQAATIDQYFSDWKPNLPTYMQNLHFVRTDDRTVIASTAVDGSRAGNVTLDEFNVPESADLRKVGDRGGYGTAPYQNPRGLPTMAYVRQTRGPEPFAVVYTVDMRAFSAAFRGGSIGSDGASELVDERTSVVVNTDDEIVATANRTWFKTGGWGQRYEDTHGVLADARDSTDVVGSTTKEGYPRALAGEPYKFSPDGYVVGWRKLELENSGVQYDERNESGWMLLVHTSKEDAYGFVSDVRRYGLIATGLGALFVLGIGAVIGRNTASSIDRLTEKAEEMEKGNLDVEFETNRIDSIGRLYDGFASMRDALKEQIEDAETARTEAERERERVERINEDLQRAAGEYCDVMGKAADGDLTVRAETETENETMRTIGEEFNAMLDEIEHTVEQLKRFAADVSAASEEVTAASREVSSASENVSDSTERISEGATRQNDSLQSVNQEMSGLSTTIEQIASSSNDVADLAAKTAKTGRRGRKAAKNALDAMDEVRADSAAAVEEIAALEEEVEQIDELIEFITDIAEQTNMLALNANIEAARSTDTDGDGFGVVAEEVKELSEDTKEAAEEIEQRLECIRNQTKRSATEVEHTSSDIAEQADAVEEAATALDEIAGFAEETNAGVQEISAATEQQAASTQEVVSTVDHAASIAEKTAAEAQQVAAAAEQQTEALGEVSTSASELAEQATQLSEALDRFDTDVDEEFGLFEPADEELAFPGDDRAVLGSGSDQASSSTFETPDVSLDDTDNQPAPDGSGRLPEE